MSRNRFVVLLVVTALVFAVVALPAGAAAKRTFTAHLKGANEIPPVQTKATGQTIFKLNKAGTAISYKLIVANIEDVAAAHIHLGAANEEGPVVVTLSGAAPGRVNGILAKGTITAADLEGPLAGMTLADLVAAIRAGDTYVNVHTVDNPDGEIRGQIR